MEKEDNSTALETIFPLLDLPQELVEQLLEHLPSRTLVQLSSCSHYFKELASSGHYWQNLIQKEKKKIICVSPDITDWKEIFKQSKEFDLLNAAYDYVRYLPSFKMILSPGSYEFGGTLYLNPNCQIIGLWETSWSQKTEDQKSIFVCYGDFPFVFTPTDVKEEKTILKNLSFIAHQSKQECLLFTFQAKNVHIENCEFNFAALKLDVNDAQYYVKNCLFEEVPEPAIDCQQVGKVIVQDCEFQSCDCGVWFGDCVETDLGPNLVEKCFFEQTDGIYFKNSTARTILRGNKILRSETWGVYLEKNCAVEMVGCTIKGCRTGMMVFEDSKVSLRDTYIINNEEYGLRIRHGVEILQFAGNRIQHNGSGVGMPRQDNPDYTEELLLKNNDISQNQFANLVLEDKKMEVETLYQDGDSEDTMKANIKVAIQQSLCTYSATKTNPIEQIWYECYTCKMGVCPICVEVCHKEHNVASDPGTAQCYWYVDRLIIMILETREF